MEYINLNLLEIPVHYINLKKDTEKNKLITENLKDLGFKKITRHEAIEHEKSLVGCSRSHHMVLNQLQPPFILFEDDIVINKFMEKINVPKNSDAIYLGNSSWGRKSSCSGPYLEYKKIDDSLYQIFNMLSAHAVLYLTEEYKNICSSIAHKFGYVYKNYQDIGFAEVQKYFNIYCFNEPLFFQSSNLPGTNKNLTDYIISEISFEKHFLPYE